MRLLVSGTDTHAGKTFVACALARELRLTSRVAAVKPWETGVVRQATDAQQLAEACEQATLYDDATWQRHTRALAPYAAHLLGEQPTRKPSEIVARIHALGGAFEHVVVEGAGGLFVPILRDYRFCDFARDLNYPLVLVVPNRLGTLSSLYAHVAHGRTLGLVTHAIVLNEVAPIDAELRQTNQAITEEIAEELGVPIVASWGYGGADAAPLLKALTRHML